MPANKNVTHRQIEFVCYECGEYKKSGNNNYAPCRIKVSVPVKESPFGYITNCVLNSEFNAKWILAITNPKRRTRGPNKIQ